MSLQLSQGNDIMGTHPSSFYVAKEQYTRTYMHTCITHTFPVTLQSTVVCTFQSNWVMQTVYGVICLTTLYGPCQYRCSFAPEELLDIEAIPYHRPRMVYHVQLYHIEPFTIDVAVPFFNEPVGRHSSNAASNPGHTD